MRAGLRSVGRSSSQQLPIYPPVHEEWADTLYVKQAGEQFLISQLGLSKGPGECSSWLPQWVNTKLPCMQFERSMKSFCAQYITIFLVPTEERREFRITNY